MDIEKTSCLTDCVQLSNELSHVIEMCFFLVLFAVIKQFCVHTSILIV